LKIFKTRDGMGDRRAVQELGSSMFWPKMNDLDEKHLE
jgi:hypothetical protein